MTTEPHDFDAALEAFDKSPEIKRVFDPPTYEMRVFFSDAEYKAVRLALRLAAEIVKEPDDALWEEGYIASGEKVCGNDCIAIFKAMRDELLRRAKSDE